MWMTVAPLIWLVSTTFTAGWQKMFSPEPRLGFLAQARALESAVAGGKVTAANLSATQTLIFNNKLDAVVCGVLMICVAITVADSLRVWYGLLRGAISKQSSETPFVISTLEAENV